MTQWLRLQTSTARGSGLVLGWGAEIPPVVQQRKIQRFPTPISSTINTWHQCSMFVTTDDPTLAQNYSIKPSFHKDSLSVLYVVWVLKQA